MKSKLQLVIHTHLLFTTIQHVQQTFLYMYTLSFQYNSLLTHDCSFLHLRQMYIHSLAVYSLLSITLMISFHIIKHIAIEQLHVFAATITLSTYQLLNSIFNNWEIEVVAKENILMKFDRFQNYRLRHEFIGFTIVRFSELACVYQHTSRGFQLCSDRHTSFYKVGIKYHCQS